MFSAPAVRGLPGYCIFLRGLSFDVTADQIAAWFDDVEGLNGPITPDR